MPKLIGYNEITVRNFIDLLELRRRASVTWRTSFDYYLISINLGISQVASDTVRDKAIDNLLEDYIKKLKEVLALESSNAQTS